MGIVDSLRQAFAGKPKIKVHLLIKGRIGEGWQDVDRTLKLSEGATLGDLIDVAESAGIPLLHALDNSPHLRDTLMHNGERCPVEANRGRVLNDGDQVYLLAPFAGG